MKNALLYLWQFPQHLLALIISLILKSRTMYSENNNSFILIMIKDMRSSFSLGKYIFLGDRADEIVILHEKGHSIQSKILGPLYLIVVGIPSAIFNSLWQKLFHKRWTAKEKNLWYYRRFPEKWADKLGGVER